MENVKNTKKWLMLFIAAASIASCSLSFGMNLLDSLFGMNIWNAIEKNNISRIKELVMKKGFDFNQTDNDGQTPLNWACLKNNIEIVKFLLDNGAKETVNKADNDCQTPLYWACGNNNLEIVKLLLPDCSIETVNKADNDRRTPLYWACWKNNLEIVRLLLEYGANIDQKSLEKIQTYLKHPEIQILAKQILVTFNLTQRFDRWVKTGEKFDLTDQERQNKRLGEFASRLLKSRRKEIIKNSEPKIGMNIWQAIEKNNISRVKELIKQEGFNFNQTNNDGRTPLYWACGNNNLEIVKFLLPDCSIETVNKADNDRRTPLYWACWNNNIEIVRLLLEWGAKESINKATRDGELPLYLACIKNNLEMVRLLLDNDAKESVNKATDDGYTPLYWACSENNLEIVKLLLPHCSIETVNKAGMAGHTPLHEACDKNLEMVKLLLEFGANINENSLIIAEYNSKYSDDHQAVAKQIFAIFNLTQRFDKWAKTGEKFDLTSEERQDKRLGEFAGRLLKSRRKEIIKKSESKIRMNIWQAIEKNNISRVKELIKQEGFNFNQTNNDGRTPLYWACWNNNIEIVRLFLEWGAKESINKATRDGELPLYSACIKNNLEMVRLLLDNDAKESVNKATDDVYTPLYWACSENNIEIVKLLLPHCSIETVNKAGMGGHTPLHEACDKNLEMVKLLLEFGANINENSLIIAEFNSEYSDDHQAVAKQIFAIFNLTQRFDKWAKTGEKFDLTSEERDMHLEDFVSILKNSKRIKKQKDLTKALDQDRFGRLDDCAVKCEFENLKEIYN